MTRYANNDEIFGKFGIHHCQDKPLNRGGEYSVHFIRVTIESKIDLPMLVAQKLPRGHSISRQSPSEIREIIKHLRRSNELPPCKFYDTLEGHAIVHYAASTMYRHSIIFYVTPDALKLINSHTGNFSACIASCRYFTAILKEIRNIMPIC